MRKVLSRSKREQVIRRSLNDDLTVVRSIAVVICTHKRVEHLSRCLSGLSAQSRPADNVIVVVDTTIAALEISWRIARRRTSDPSSTSQGAGARPCA